ncbi:MAG: extracellular solute-binding protein [Acutalibacteraceae bacterium]
MFKKTKRVLGVILAGLMVASAFAGCNNGNGNNSSDADSSSDNPSSQVEVTSYTVDEMMADAAIAMGDEDKVTLKVWAPQAAQEIFKKQCDDFSANFKKLGKTVKIELSVQGESNAASLVMTDPDAAADVFAFASDQGLALYKDQYLLPVRLNYVEPIREAHIADSVETAMFKAASDETELLYAYPETGDNGYALFYDKRILTEKDVETLEGVMAVCNEQKKNFAMEMGDGFYGCVIPFTGGGTLGLEDDLETQILNYDYEKIAPVAKAFSELLSTSKYYKNESVNSTLVSGFKNETYAAGVIGSWQIKAIKGALGDNMGVAKLPTIKVDGKDTQMISIYGYKNLGVNAKTKYPLTAQALAYYLSGEKCQKERLEEIGWGPSVTALINSDAVKKDVALSAIYEQQKYSLPQKDIISGWWSPTGSYSAYVVDSTKKHDDATMKEEYDAMVETIEMG